MMYLTLILFREEFFQIVSISFTVLLITELVIVAACVHHRVLWRQRRLHFALFLLAEAASLFMFFLAVLFLPDTFDRNFFFSVRFLQNVCIIAAASIGPVLIIGLVAKPLHRCAVHYKNT